MEQLKKRYDSAVKALKTLEEALDGFARAEKISKLSGEPPEQVRNTYRDSMIQRFEYTYDGTWKYIKLYLQDAGITLRLVGPKSIFKECVRMELIKPEQGETAMKMVDARNETTHHYDEAVIEEIAKQIPVYYEILQTILEKATPDKS